MAFNDKIDELYGFSFSKEANPVTIFIPLSPLFGFTAGNCHAGLAVAVFAASDTTVPICFNRSFLQTKIYGSD
ncbi:hypothetical protein MTR_3g015120 [Medicago truncatula]|nr:hypothetical protein MTR_3g015120 [Medicago truncatula]